MTKNLAVPGHYPAVSGRSAPAPTLPRQLRMTGTALMVALFGVHCGQGNEAALEGEAPPVTRALTSTFINDANVPRCPNQNSCRLSNGLTNYQKGLLDDLVVRVSPSAPPSLGTCSPVAGLNSATWTMSASEFMARVPLLNSAQAKISVTCTDGVLTGVTAVALPIVLTASPQSPSLAVLNWSLPKAPPTYRYNVYRDSVRVASSVSGFSFNSATQDGIGHVYFVEVDPASAPGVPPTVSPRIAVMQPSVASSLWMAGSTLSRVDPATGWKGQLNQQTWTFASGMTDMSGYLLIVRDKILHKVSMYTGEVQALGGQNWFGLTFLAPANGGVYIWESDSIWKVNQSTGAFTKNGTLAWSGVSAMTSDSNELFIIRNQTLYSYSPALDSRQQLGAAGAWPNTPRMIWSWKKIAPGNFVARLYMLKNGKLWESDVFGNSAAPVGNDSWSINSPLSSNDDFLFVLDQNSFYKVDKLTGTRAVVATGWQSFGFLAPN